MKPAILPSILLAAAFAALAADESKPAPEPDPEPWKGKVIAVQDGDSLTVLKHQKTQVRIQLVAIDAPELGQEFGRKAKEQLSDLTFGKMVRVYPEGLDPDGQTLARVMVANKDINYTMVSRGFAWHYRKNSDSERLQKAEDRAKKREKGLWAPGNAMAPWEYRKIAPKMKAARLAAAEKAEKKQPEPQPAVTKTKPKASKSTPELTHWITSSSRKRHNSSCRWFQNSKGRMCSATEGKACKVCGG